MDRRTFLAVSTAAALSKVIHAEAVAVSPPAPFGALPSPRQLGWHQLETYAFLHFTVNTFTALQWGNGDEDPNIFNPTDFDPDAIVLDLKRAGMKAVLLTCKHHDGFCLWPTKSTAHSVSHSSWRDGKGDVVRDISDAARRHGLKFGVYVSPWDRNNAYYGKPEYLPIYRQQITELLTNYGEIFEVWFDGANGGDGYYGGAREKRTIDTRTYYEWPTIFELVRRLQPQAVIFAPQGDVRWIGNERGVANETCWATVTDNHPGDNINNFPDGETVIATGTRFGKLWYPAEADVSIRPGWFYDPKQDNEVRTPDNLVDLYFKSVGRGTSFLLNLPPDRRGRIPAQDAAASAAYFSQIEKLFSRNLAAEAALSPSNVRGNQTQFGVQNLLDGDASTYWATDDDVPTPELVLEFKRPTMIGVIRLKEALRLGQRIGSIALDLWENDGWTPFASATSIGPCRLIRLDTPIQVERLRLRVTESPVAIALSELGVYEG